MEKWADYLIFSVKYDEKHSHIVSVKAHEDLVDKLSSSEFEFKREDVISAIKTGKTFYSIYKNEDTSKWSKGEKVSIVTIDTNEFIKTDENKKKVDNLGTLPEY